MMKKWKFSAAGAVFCSAVLLGSSALAAVAVNKSNKPAKEPPRKPEPVSNQVLVSFKAGASASEVVSMHSQAGGKVLKKLSRINVELVEVPEGKVADAIKAYKKNPKVAFAEPNYRRTLTTTEGSMPPPYNIANDFTEQWHLHNTGQGFGAVCGFDLETFEYVCDAPAYWGTPDADIDAPEGWALTQGSADIKIAVLDSGVDCVHPDLNEKCVEQINFADGCTNVNDYVGHGTHVASIAAAETNNGVGTAGVAWNAKIGSLKVCAEVDTGLGYAADCRDGDLVEAIIYAADHGYQVINMSIAGPENSAAIENAVNYAWSKGVVIVAGAGNNYTTIKQYPAGYEHVLSVAATDHYDNLAEFSTFSTDSDDWVSVAAPGDIIFAAVPSLYCEGNPDCYDWKSGTSMATPVVSGIAAMVWSYIQNPTNAAVRDCIEKSAQPSGVLGQNFLAWTKHGRVNLHDALLCIDNKTDLPPVARFDSSISGLSVTFTDHSTDDSTVASWSWDFGDSSTSTAQNPTHTYAAAGTYSVKLLVTDNGGKTNEVTNNVTVTAAPLIEGPPDAQFDYAAATGRSIAFTDKSTDADGTIASRSWNFGDGSAADTAQNPTHTYTAAGTYSVKLTVTDNEDKTDSVTQSVVVSNAPPAAQFDYAAATGRSIAFTDKSTDTDGTIASRSWDFGDNSTAETAQNPTHAYTAAGTYSVTLTVTDNDGTTDSISLSVAVENAPPKASFSYAASGNDFSFTDTSADTDGTIASWSWDFGDSGTATAQNPTHSYAAAGSYPVELTVTDNDGKTDTVAQNVTICPDSEQCVDADADGVPDKWDECADTPANTPVNSKGCPVQPKVIVIPVGGN